jgi:hypothetical protein
MLGRDLPTTASKDLAAHATAVVQVMKTLWMKALCVKALWAKAL